MDQQYINVCSKILQYYKNLLSEKEIMHLYQIIESNKVEDQIFINKLIDRIWHLTLTSKESFKQGEPFTFLVLNGTIGEIIGTNPHTLTENRRWNLKLITDKNISQEDLASGYSCIVEIDYLNNFSEPILPIDLSENTYINGKLNIVSIYTISLNINDYSDVSAHDFAQSLGLSSIQLIKPIYNQKNENVILTERDKDLLTRNLITDYTCDYHILVSDITPIANELKNLISKKYEEYYQNQITLEEFYQYVINLIENHPTIKNAERITPSEEFDIKNFKI